MKTFAAEHLRFSYDGVRDIFSDISLSVRQGEVFAILGCNGAGKSTLLNCLARQITPDGGGVTLDGMPCEKMPRRIFARHVGYVPQFHQSVFAYTVEEFVVMGRAPHLQALQTPGEADYEIARTCMERVGVAHLAQKSYLEISGGERQMVLFAQALAQQPDFLVLDEPTSHLDFGNQVRCLQMIERLAEQGYGILLTSHFPDHSLMFSHRVGVLHEGRFLAMGPAEEAINQENMQRIYGVQVEIRRSETLHRMTCLARNDSNA